ncbi:hypothetical protein B296_00047790 [Ensete ventricosum]|uniref:Uncharacterized protein n=1 Tax=Ensete ventricosum TaxID=4639 RepID=A0A426X843_ENSVE|nr:hypothetical protein B296_00047790 [Ensete ventricosum]
MAWPPARGRPARKGGACGHNARRQAAYEQKLTPARAVARRGNAHGGATHGCGTGRKGSSAHPLAGRLPAGKGTAACVGALVAA